MKPKIGSVRKQKGLGLDLSPAELDLLLAAKGTSLFSLKNELDKIRAYCGQGKKPTSMEEWNTLLGKEWRPISLL